MISTDPAPGEDLVHALISQRERFHRFLAARLGSAADAEDVLQQSLLKALKKADGVRRDESVVPWFYRVLRNAIADFYRVKRTQEKRLEAFARETTVREDGIASPVPTEWEEAVCSCFQGLLPTLKPRYVELLTRIDLNGETKSTVRQDLQLSPAAFDVALHRARGALRRRLEVFCGACSQEACIACTCEQEKTKQATAHRS